LEAAVDFHLGQARRHRRNLDVFFWPPLMAALLPERPGVALWEESEGLADDAQAAPMALAEPVARTVRPAAEPAPAAARRPGKPGGYCELHRCGITDCFCFD
jgi:hypothetical protein